MFPWTSTVRHQTLIVAFPARYRVLSWAPLQGGFVEAQTILNHQVNTHEHSTLEPESFLNNLAQQLRVDFPVVGLMTGVLMERHVRRMRIHDDLMIECFATVGLSNALTVGDPATYDEQFGTINCIVTINQPLTPAAMVEAVQIVTEAKVRAVQNAGVKSTVSGTLATGTGTDCVVVACSTVGDMYRYCGKHTKLGELIGQVVLAAVGEGIRKAKPA